MCHGEMYGDSKHEVTMLDGGYELHEFTNGAGATYSAIYSPNGEYEVCSCERWKEQDMLKRFNRDRYIYDRTYKRKNGGKGDA